MNGVQWRTVRTIAAKDLKEVRQNRAAWAPAIVIPLLFVVVMPLAIILIPRLFEIPPETLNTGGGLDALRNRLPAAAARELAGLDTMQTWVVLMTGFMLAPLFLILPLMFSSIVGAESFVGEKERKTLETLLYSPASDTELFLGKVAASIVPAVALAWVSFLVYAVVVNVAAWPVMGRVWFPLPSWWVLMLWVTPAVAGLGMAAAVLISARVNTYMEAYQLTGALSLFVVALVAGQASGVLFLSVGVAVVVGLLVWLLDAALLWLGVRTFSRSELLAKL
jgi:ABC-type Na+ efflux pump permease subunit